MQVAPNLKAPLYAVGVAIAAGKVDTAAALLAKLDRQYPNNPEIAGMAGRLALVEGRLSDAVPLLQRATAGHPCDENRICLALCLAQLGRRVEALAIFDLLGDAVPDTVSDCLMRAVALQEMGETNRALPYAQRLVALAPGDAQAQGRLGVMLRVAGRPAEGIAPLIEAIRLDGSNADHYIDLAAALADCGSFVQGLQAAEIAAVLAPNSPEAHNNVGLALLNLNRSVEAIAAYDRALALKPDYGVAAFGRASALLKSGHFAPGWAAYESRWNGVLKPRTDLTAPLWQGEPRAGRTLLVHCEQGFGDSLQFARYVQHLDPADGAVIFEVPRPLLRLFGTLPGHATLVEFGTALPAHDLHCPLVSLPHFLGLPVPTDTAPYLSAAPFIEAASGKSADAPQPFTVGLVWSGDPRPHDVGANLIDRRRSLSFSQLAPLLEVENIRFLSFQHGTPAAQRTDAVANAIDGITDFADTAARLAGIDLLISVDTSMVHLAGALGCPVWMLSRFDACWRWGDTGDTSPWYPNLCIFRQPEPGAWAPAISAVAQALRLLTQNG